MGREPLTPPKDENWTKYFDAVAGLPPRETLMRALDLFDSVPRSDGLAVDLGCGEGRDTAELLRGGWRVLAIDDDPGAIERLRACVPAEDSTRLQTRLARFQETPIPPCDLVNASFSIPHCSRDEFGPMWARIVAAIRRGGRFAGQLFGIRDEWATGPDGITRTYHSREQVAAMLEPFETEFLDEVERPGKTALGEPKYWHVFHIVARKR
jgi:SAM-dependent methyltransferase